MTNSAASYLRLYLGPFVAQLDRPEVTDIYVNQPREIWTETLGGAIERHDAGDLTEELLWRLAHQVANVTHQGISREHPLLAARLPDGERIQIVAPPATRGPLALAIRKHVSLDLTLDDFDAAGTFETTRAGAEQDPADVELARLYEAGQWSAFLRAAIAARKTILLSGGTSSGKTTLLNALLREIDARERLILVEDTPELQLHHHNAIGLVAARGELGEANVTTDDLLIASLRMRPDRIILGELRGTEAFTFLRAINTGHPGSITTIHADTPARALEQLALLVMRSGVSLRREDIMVYAHSVIDIVVQLHRRDGVRRVSQVLWNRSLAGEMTPVR